MDSEIDLSLSLVNPNGSLKRSELDWAGSVGLADPV
jgi:hypothetical protein